MTVMSLISDVLLLAATFGLAGYCFVLSRRLKAFNDVETGVGGTIASLSLQVDRLQESLSDAESGAQARLDQLKESLEVADERIGRLDVLLASLDDVEADFLDPVEPEAPPEEMIVPSFRASRAPAIEWPAR